MILNAYAVLDAFVGLLRFGLGLLVIALGLAVWRAWRRSIQFPEERKKLEDRCYLLFLLGGLLLCLNIVAWPLFYLLLQSYVPQWTGVMCIYGVTQIGKGSMNSSRYLPSLITAVQIFKPILIFLSGTWFVLYLVNRRTRTAPLTGRVLLVLLVAGGLAVADAAAEVAYIGIPKKEERPTGGCCTMSLDQSLPAVRAFCPRPGCRRAPAADCGAPITRSMRSWRWPRGFVRDCFGRVCRGVPCCCCCSERGWR